MAARMGNIGEKRRRIEVLPAREPAAPSVPAQPASPTPEPAREPEPTR